MILSNHKHLFGFTHAGIIESKLFTCMVSTAPEKFFKEYSIVIVAVDGSWRNRQNKRVAAKALLHPNLSKAKRAEIHGTVIAHLNDLGELGFNLGQALDEVFMQMKQRNITVGVLNQAHA